MRVGSWLNFTDTRCESSNPSSTDGGSFSWTNPNYEALLDRLKVVAGDLFRARGETVTDIEIIASEKPALHVFH